MSIPTATAPKPMLSVLSHLARRAHPIVGKIHGRSAKVLAPGPGVISIGH